MPFSHAPVSGQGNIVVSQIQSPNYDPAAGTGWRIAKDGSATFYDVNLPGVQQGAKVTFASTAPASPRTGDLWYDVADGLQLSQWNGTSWVPYQIGTGAIAAQAVTTGLIADAAVGTGQVAPAAITAALLAAGAAAGNLSPGDITADLLAAGAALANVGTGGITAGYLAAGAVVAGAIAAGAVTASAIAAGTVVAGIVDGTEIDSATFKGTNWVENSSGMFLYSGTPAAGNLLMSVAPAAGTDAHGNAYQAGTCVYGTSPSFTALQEVGGQAVLVVQPAGTWTPGNAVSPVIFSGASGSGTSESQYLQVDSGAPPGQASRRSRIILSSGSPDGTSSVPHIGFYGGNGDLLVADLSTAGLAAAVNGVLQGWQPMTLQNGWAVGSGGIARYKLMPDHTVMIQLVNVTPGITTDGTIIWVFPAGYQPVTEQKLPLIAQYSTAPAYGSMPFLYVNTASGGALVVYNLRGTVSDIHATTFYTLD